MVYIFFINRKDKIEEAIHNANLYLKRWKPKYENKVIVEVLMELYNESVLDLDEVENQEVFNLFVEENQEDI